MRKPSLEVMRADKGIRFTLTVPVIFKGEGDWVYSSCEILDVHSQGRTHTEAKRNIIEALQLFVESCFRRGTLEQVLKECNFEPAGRGIEIDVDNDSNVVDVPIDLLVANHVQQAAAH